MRKKPVAYSAILIKFIEPILTGQEYLEEYMLKAKLGMIAWNYHVADQNNLPFNKMQKAIMKKLCAQNKEGKALFDMLVKRKAMHFSEYNQFLAKVEHREKPDGSVTLYVESGPVDKLWG